MKSCARALSHTLRPVIVAVAVICMAFAPTMIAHADIVSDSGARAVAWLASHQQADGGFNGLSQNSDVGTTADAIVALVAANKPILSVKNNAGLTPLDYLRAQVNSSSLKTGEYSKMVLAVQASGLNPISFGGRNLIALIMSGYNNQTGVFGDTVFVHSLALIALTSAKVAVPAKAITTLESLQTPAGGWAFMGKGDPDVDTTALAVQALIAVGQPANNGAAGRGLGYLHGLQNSDGGFPYQSPSAYGTDTNANSTGLVAQAIIASGDQPESWAAAKGNPLSAIIVLQQRSGAFTYQSAYAGDNVLATVGAIQALYRITTNGK
jgi:Prenyltransferase and squalene oxidase repeat